MQARFLLLHWIMLFCFSSCSRQHIVSVSTPLFINFPINTHVFDNIAPMVYEALHQELIRTGFSVVDTPQHAYRLIIEIKSLEPFQKNISPDIVLLSYKVRMEYNIKVLNYAGAVVFNRPDSCAILISKPRNPMLNDTFIYSTYQILATRAARLIQQQLITNIKHIFSP
ncbi:hypothetical protein FJ365_03835 [Candidatus Dependentiae bacterium]|nr:hypothetical protein [Candidatus Dependentiae bacterium]